ncbi:pleckstrin homology domain-containing family G member 7 isoform X2 [Moschus berezovskii]|uniref:pleckstrin homology domain-containing family G member 7 isoform X2 n=1 Tax=Moschus berezovskii TaxID=68408 RepID=UPI0024444AAD|nr:pleckstrin homology domain-containing family G member 7 isoform X2 [Moschus berezovskii]
MEKMEPSRQEVQPTGCEASPPYSLESLSQKHGQNQGNLLHFDRQAPSRLSTSPTLRRLRSRGCGSARVGPRGTATAHAPPPCVASEVRPGGGPQECPGSARPLYNQPCESTEESSRSLWPLSLHSRLPPDPERALDAAESVELQLGPGEERAPPVPQHLEEGSLPQASFPRRGDHPAPSHTPGPPGPQREELHQYRFYEHRRSSVVLNLPGLEVFPGDLLVSAGAADYLCHPLLLLNSESKKPRWPFSKRGVQGKDKNKHISDLEDCLSSLKITDFRDYEFHTLKDKTWNEVMEMHQKLPTNQLDLRKQEAVWELFTSECTYFLDHLLVLKMIFMNTLKYLQTHEYLLDVDLWRLFANLEELSQTSFGFVNSLFRIFKDYIDICETSPSLDFISVLTKWCEQNEQCRRLHLPELLVAPLHRLTRYPLLLKNIWKRSTDSTEKIMTYSIKEKVEKSIRDLEGKVKWLDSFQKFRHLQEIVVWPPLWDRDKRFFIPECLKHIFKEHMAENILSPTNRHLLYEGKLTLAESTRFLDVYLFLFDDFLLVTKTKRNKKKLGGSDSGLMCPSLTPELQTVIKEGGSCTVIDQPIPLDRLVIRSLDPLHVSVFGLRNAFLIQHENRYRQCIAAFLLQAQTENIKRTWIAQITAAISCFTKSQETKKMSSFTLPAESSEI